MAELTTIRERLERVLVYSQLSEKEFADKIGVGRGTLANTFKGRNNPSLDICMRVLDTYKEISGEWLMRGTGVMLSGVAEDAVYSTSKLSANSARQQDVHTPDMSHANNQNASSNSSNITNSNGADDSGADPFHEFLYGKSNLSKSNQQHDTLCKCQQEIQPVTQPHSPTLSTPQNSILTKQRSITEIRVFYDDNTYDTFSNQ